MVSRIFLSPNTQDFIEDLGIGLIELIDGSAELNYSVLYRCSAPGAVAAWKVEDS